jgi:transcriptional regulator with XRE-family HTH domain
MAHWTEENADAFAHRIAFDFIAQLEKKLETLPLSQKELARKLAVSEGAVSKVLNNPQNLTLKTIVKYSRALGIKATIVAYDDNDPNNEKGIIASEVFATSWERAGKPRDVWALDVKQSQQLATSDFMQVVRHRLLGYGVNSLPVATSFSPGQSGQVIVYSPGARPAPPLTTAAGANVFSISQNAGT